MNRIHQLFKKKKKNILCIYYTAGFPNLEDTLKIAISLEKAGVDIIEIGAPFSDPLADGPTIQKSSQKALENGMSLSLLFNQLENLRKHVSIPVLLMGYLNPILQMGFNKFLQNCKKVGLDGIIVPDLPIEEYEKNYKIDCQKNDLCSVFFITPETSKTRQQKIDNLSSGFLYAVSSASTTGTKKKEWSTQQQKYFQ